MPPKVRRLQAALKAAARLEAGVPGVCGLPGSEAPCACAPGTCLRARELLARARVPQRKPELGEGDPRISAMEASNPTVRVGTGSLFPCPSWILLWGV